MASIKEWIEKAKIIYHPAWIRRWKENPFSVPPIYLEASPAGGCNHRCTHCAPDFLGYKVQFLSPEIMKARFDEMRQMREEDPDGLGVKSIQFAGEGEPTTHKNFWLLCKYAKEAGLDVGILTNATGLIEKTAYSLLPHVNGYLQASINGGTREVYSKIHRVHPNHWDLVWRNLEKAVKIKNELDLKDCELGANMTVIVKTAWDHVKKCFVQANWETMEDLAGRARDTGLDYVSFKPYSQHPLSIETAKLYGDMTYVPIMEELLKKGEEMTKKYNSEKFEVVFRFSRFQEYENDFRGYSQCQSTPTLWSYIQSDGKWISCSGWWSDERFVLGNINTQTFKEIWYGELRRKHLDFVLNHLDISECRKTCHPDKDNVFLNKIRQMDGEEFNAAIVELEKQPKPKRSNFI